MIGITARFFCWRARSNPNIMAAGIKVAAHILPQGMANHRWDIHQKYNCAGKAKKAFSDRGESGAAAANPPPASDRTGQKKACNGCGDRVECGGGEQLCRLVWLMEGQCKQKDQNGSQHKH